MYYVYVLLSLKYKRLYIGFSNNPFKRRDQHNNGDVPSTKPYRPYKLIYYEAMLDKKDAMNREVYLKSGWGRRSLKKVIENYLSEYNLIEFNIIE